MAKLFEKVVVEIEVPFGGGTFTDVTPTVPDLIFSKKRQRGQYFYRLSLEGELLLRKAAWDFVSDLEITDHCSDLGIRVRCGLDTLFEGKIKLGDGEFDFSSCLATIEATTEDEYSCIEAGLKKETNILASPTSEETLYFLIGEIETQRCPPASTTSITGLLPVNPPVEDSCLTDPDTWSLLENHFTFITPSGAGASPPFTAEHYSVWVRQTVDSATQPPGIGWVNISGITWVRPVVTVFDEVNSTSPPPEEDNWHQLYTLAWGGETEIDNGVPLGVLIDFMLDQIDCSLTVVSDYFGINPDATHPVNTAYTAALEKMQNLLIFQISDVKRSDVSNNATIGLMTLDELFQFFTVLDVFPSIMNGALRIEHISFYENKPVSLDLTASPYLRWMKRKNKYTYDNSDNPRYEKFAWGTNTNSGSFNATDIQYGAACSSKDNDTVQHNSGKFITDLASVITTPEKFSDDGFVVVNAISFLGDLYADTELGVVNGEELLNGHLSFPNILDKYWRNYAYQSTGLLNNTSITFDSIRPNKKGEAIVLPGWCCSDFLDFDPTTLVTTEIGDGEVEKITWSARSGTVTFELSYGGGTTTS